MALTARFMVGIRHERDDRTEGDSRRTWYDAASVQLGRYDVAEGWRIIEGMRGGCHCDLSQADCIVARHPCWTKGSA
jgi:hypothetical protein